MKKLFSALTAALILGTGGQALAAGCENGACELPQKEAQSCTVGSNNAYCYGSPAQKTRSEESRSCGCYGRR